MKRLKFSKDGFLLEFIFGLFVTAMVSADEYFNGNLSILKIIILGTLTVLICSVSVGFLFGYLGLPDDPVEKNTEQNLNNKQQ